jgi:hypothetical protein
MRIALYVLHYGAEYLAHSIRSIQDAVDEIYVLYTSRPSFGHGASVPCVDTEETLFEQARRFCKKPLRWVGGSWGNEGDHRNAIYPIARERGVKQILVVDADEVWMPGQAEAALAYSSRHEEGIVRVRFCHFYRSFLWVCFDPCMPVRVLNLHNGVLKPGEWYLSPQDWPVLHFGYAQTPATISYKWKIHGHSAEYRTGWLEEKFLAWKPGCGIGDVHPTCVNFWNPLMTTPQMLEGMKEVLGDHPYWGKELIG